MLLKTKILKLCKYKGDAIGTQCADSACLNITSSCSYKSEYNLKKGKYSRVKGKKHVCSHTFLTISCHMTNDSSNKVKFSSCS